MNFLLKIYSGLLPSVHKRGEKREKVSPKNQKNDRLEAVEDRRLLTPIKKRSKTASKQPVFF
jgi:hypothetical protein